MIKRHTNQSRQVSESDSVRRVTVGGVWPALTRLHHLKGQRTILLEQLVSW